MNEQELRKLIGEVIHEELTQLKLKEAVEGAGYVIKAWSSTEQKASGTPTYDSVKEGKTFKDFAAVIEALQSSELSELGAYEITWVKSGTTLEESGLPTSFRY